MTPMISPLIAICLAVTLLASQGTPSTQPGESAAFHHTNFLRLLPDGKGGATLEIAQVNLINDAGQTVALIASIHFAEESFYIQLNRAFNEYQTVFYELVTASPQKGRPLPAPMGTRYGDKEAIAWQGNAQVRMAKVLGLVHQFDVISYNRGNFVHGDLDLESLQKLEDARVAAGGTPTQKSARKPPPPPTKFDPALPPPPPAATQRSDVRGDADSADPLFELAEKIPADDRQRQLRLLFAYELAQDPLPWSPMDDDSPRTTDRSRHALKLLDQRMHSTKQKRFALFFGFEHMRRMEKILTEEMGFKPAGEPVWRVAWIIPPAHKN